MSKNEKIAENVDCKLNYIGSLIADDFVRGYYPHWNLPLLGIHHNELSDATLDHISKYVADGYVEGEIIENYHKKFDRGWWRLET